MSAPIRPDVRRRFRAVVRRGLARADRVAVPSQSASRWRPLTTANLEVSVTFMSTLGEAVKRHREAKGWSQRELAARALVTGAYVAMLETGAKRRASVTVLRRFERAFGTPVGTLEALAHLPREWWRAEDERELRDASGLRTGPFFTTRDEAEDEARRRECSFVARYQDKPGAFIRRAFPVRPLA